MSARRAALAAIANQALSSGSNFAYTAFLISTVNPAEFGTYGLLLSALYLYVGLTNATLTIQLVIIYPKLPPPDREAAALNTVALIVLAGAATIAIVASIAAYVGDADISRMLLVTAAASVCASMREFFTRYAYSRDAQSSVFVQNMAAATALFVAVILLRENGVTMNGLLAIGVFGFSQLMSGCAGLLQSQIGRAVFVFGGMRALLARQFRARSWSAGGVAVAWGQSQSYVYLAAGILGTAVVGYMNAARIFITPFQVASSAVAQVALPRLAASGNGQVKQAAQRYLLGVAVCGLVYSAIVVIAFVYVEELLRHTPYSGLSAYVIGWCVVMFAQALRESASVAMQAGGFFKAIFGANIVSAAATIALSIAGGVLYGGIGMLYALAFGELLLGLLLWRHLRCSHSP